MPSSTMKSPTYNKKSEETGTETKQSTELLSSGQIAAKRYAEAKTSIFLSIISTAVLFFLFSLPYWSFLPLLVVHLELISRLYDTHLLGNLPKIDGPHSSFKNPTSDYTWKQLAHHCTEQSAWISINGLVYDITSFVDKHPGGRELLLLCTGRDATDLFNSYHPFTDLPKQVLKKYHIGSLTTYEHPIYKPDTGFYKEASNEIGKYFKNNNIDSKNPYTGFYRMTPVYILFGICYYIINSSNNWSLSIRFLSSIVLGICQGMPLTGWMHDASHASIGRSERWWWNVGRLSLDYFSGSSMLSWRNQHVIGHHVYTNVMGSDPDLPAILSGDPRRLMKEQTYFPIYKLQHYYLPPLYGILGLKSRVQDFTEVFSSHTNGPIRVNPIITQDHLRMISSKCTWFFYRVIIPYVFFKTQYLIPLFFVTEFTTGYWLGFNFQVSHISDEADFLMADPEKKRNSGHYPVIYDDEWALSQIKTTVDYGHNNKIATYLSGALNYQTIHHLFPSVSQYHYPEITPIVMKIAEKHGVKFNVFDGYGSAFMAHWRHLRNLSREGKVAELKLE